MNFGNDNQKATDRERCTKQDGNRRMKTKSKIEYYLGFSDTCDPDFALIPDIEVKYQKRIVFWFETEADQITLEASLIFGLLDGFTMPGTSICTTIVNIVIRESENDVKDLHYTEPHFQGVFPGLCNNDMDVTGSAEDDDDNFDESCSLVHAINTCN